MREDNMKTYWQWLAVESEEDENWEKAVGFNPLMIIERDFFAHD